MFVHRDWRDRYAPYVPRAVQALIISFIVLAFTLVTLFVARSPLSLWVALEMLVIAIVVVVLTRSFMPRR